MLNSPRSITSLSGASLKKARESQLGGGTLPEDGIGGESPLGAGKQVFFSPHFFFFLRWQFSFQYDNASFFFSSFFLRRANTGRYGVAVGCRWWGSWGGRNVRGPNQQDGHVGGQAAAQANRTGQSERRGVQGAVHVWLEERTGECVKLREFGTGLWFKMLGEKEGSESISYLNAI